MNINKKFHIEYFVFVLSIFYLIFITNLYYPSVLSPDLHRYKTYLEYFFTDQTKIISEQGTLYYYIISIFVYLQINSIETSSPLNFTDLDNQINFRPEFLSETELNFGLGIQNGNFIIYLIGLYGLFKILRIFNTEKHIAIFTLAFINILPITFQLLVTMKPEIFGFALLIWIIYFIELYKERGEKIYIFSSAIFLSVLLNTKASISAISLIIIFIQLLENWRKLNLDIKSFTFGIITLVVFTFSINYENSKIVENNFLSRSNLNDIYDQPEYDNKAPANILYNIDFKNLIYKPVKNYHADSIIGITLLDNFGDYFNEYWNKDYTFFKKYSKNFIVSSDKVKFDLKNRILYQNFFSFELNNIRRLVSLFLSLLFYTFTFITFFKKKGVPKFIILGPFIGIIILFINSLGIPENNFDPLTGDLFKTYYYSFIFLISFTFVLRQYLIKNKKLINFIFFLALLVLCLFILGFPMANNSLLDRTLENINSFTYFCEINKQVLKITNIEYFKVKCVDHKFFNNFQNISFVDNIKINFYSILTIVALIFIDLIKSYNVKDRFFKYLDKK